MSSYLFPAAEQLAAVNLIKAPFAASGVMGLLSSLLPLSPEPTLAALAAAEANFTGYARKTIASLPAAYYDTVRGGVSFVVPTQQWSVAAPGSGSSLVGNTIYGGFYLDVSNNILVIWTINPGYPLLDIGDALPLELLLNFFSTNADSVTVTINGQPR